MGLRHFYYSLLTVFSMFFIYACHGQHKPSVAEISLPEQIKQVEHGLCGNVMVEGEQWSIQDRMAYYKIQGVSIAVIHNYKLVWAKGYGWANVNKKIPVTENTLFQAASISKSINGMGLLKLAQDNKLDLDADVNNYLKGWKFPYDSVSKGKKITAFSLLKHTSGVNSCAPEYLADDTIPTLVQVLNGQASPSHRIYSTIEAIRSIAEPETVYKYSNTGIGITQLMVTDITGLPYEQYIAEHVFKPLGMAHSYYSIDSIKKHNLTLATGYLNGIEVQGKNVVVGIKAAGGLFTTPTDLAKFIIDVQLSRENRSNKVLTMTMVQKMLTRDALKRSPGVFVRDMNGTMYFEHGGSLPGVNTDYWGSVEGGDGVVVMVNAGSSTAFIQELVNSVASVYQWKDFYKPTYKKAVAIPENAIRKYVGVYTTSDNAYTIILEKENAYSLYADGVYSKIYFTNQDDFFNLEFPTEKHTLRDASGNVTGYTRTLNGQAQPALTKVQDPKLFNATEDVFGSIGWAFLENKNYKEACAYLERGAQLYPKSLMLSMNLAHAYLFSNNLDGALKIYKAHMNETVTGNTKWQDMIASDFQFFKNDHGDKRVMDEAIAALKMNKPEGW